MTDTKKPFRILIVDDEESLREILTIMLHREGYRVDAAADGAQALTHLKEHPYDLVISDIVMAGEMNGIELAHAVREKMPHLPILLVTGYSDQLGAAEAGFTVLRKPYRLVELNRAIAKAILDGDGTPPKNVVKLRTSRRPE